MSDAIYRQLNETDYVRYAQIEGHAFNFKPSPSLTPEEWASMRGLFVGGEMVALLGTLALRMHTGGGEVACLGLGGVATPPEQRRRGHVASLLRSVCDEWRANGTYWCMLHPFKESFYHRFGWTVAMERRVYSGAPALLSSFRESGGAFVLVTPDAHEEINAVYTRAFRGRWGPTERDSERWRRLMSGRARPRYSYIWRDDAGKARAYLIYTLNETPNGLVMDCSEIGAVDSHARSQLFAFMANHDSQCAEVRFPAPADAPVNLLMPDPLRCEVQPWSMLRPLDIVGALNGYPAPRGVEGRCTLAVHDDWLAYNQGTFALEIADGTTTCTPTSGDADITVDVRVLTQLMTRYLRPRTAAAFGMLDVHSRPALSLLDRFFAGLMPFNSDSF